MARKLTPKQARFVQEYLIDCNGAQAAIRAGYSPRGAKESASRLLTYDNVAGAVSEARTKQAERAELTADEVIKGLRSEANFKGDGTSHSARVSAWSWLGRRLKLFTNKHEHAGADGGPIRIRTELEIEDAINDLHRLGFVPPLGLSDPSDSSDGDEGEGSGSDQGSPVDP